jgi:hypothetical protein
VPDVAALTEALARSERRHVCMNRTLRWGTLVLVTLISGVAALTVGHQGTAYAVSGESGCDRTCRELEGIDPSIGMFAFMRQAAANATLG